MASDIASRMKAYFLQVGDYGASDRQLHAALGSTARTIIECRKALCDEGVIEKASGLTRKGWVGDRKLEEEVYRTKRKAAR